MENQETDDVTVDVPEEEVDLYFQAQQELNQAMWAFEVGIEELKKASPPRQTVQITVESEAHVESGNNVNTEPVVEKEVVEIEPLSQEIFARDLQASTLESAASTLESPSSTLEVATTLEAPASTLEAPASTLEAPASTLEALTSTLEAPVSTLEAPASTMEAPASTMEAPASTMEAPTSTMQAPASTLEVQSSTLEAPTSTLEASTSTLEEPTSTWEEPTSTSEEPTLIAETSEELTLTVVEPNIEVTEIKNSYPGKIGMLDAGEALMTPIPKQDDKIVLNEAESSGGGGDAPSETVEPDSTIPEIIPQKLILAGGGDDDLPATETEGESDEPLSEIDSMLAKCKAIALEKAFHATLVKDEVMCSFLVYCLGEDSEERVFRALDVFHLLAINSENRSGLSKVPMFFEGLKSAACNKKLNKEVRDFALLIYGNVKKIHKPLKAQRGNRITASSTSQGPGAKDKADKAEHQHKAQSVKNQSLSKTGRASQFYIPQCIFKDKRLRMTEALLTLHGVISITYDMNKSYCVVRGKPHVPSEMFGKAIANLGFECHMVTKSENNEDTLTRMTSDSKFENSKSLYEQENTPGPDYLSDSDAELNTSQERAQAVALPGKEKKKTGWISSASNFLQKSFYW